MEENLLSFFSTAHGSGGHLTRKQPGSGITPDPRGRKKNGVLFYRWWSGSVRIGLPDAQETFWPAPPPIPGRFILAELP